MKSGSSHAQHKRKTITKGPLQLSLLGKLIYEDKFLVLNLSSVSDPIKHTLN